MRSLTRYLPAMSSMRHVAAFFGPMLAGTAIGVNAAPDYGPAVLGFFVGTGIGVTLTAFVPRGPEGSRPRGTREG
jgi:hypothetical protein